MQLYCEKWDAGCEYHRYQGKPSDQAKRVFADSFCEWVGLRLFPCGDYRDGYAFGEPFGGYV